MKKLLSLLLTATMLCALTLPVLATTPADNAQTRNADIFDFIDILEDCVGMIELTPVEVYDHNKNGVVDIFDGIIVLEGIIGIKDSVKMPLRSGAKWTEVPIKRNVYWSNPAPIPFELKQIVSENNYIFSGTIVGLKEFEVEWTDELGEQWGPYSHTLMEVKVNKEYHGESPVKDDILKIFYPYSLSIDFGGSFSLEENNEYVFISRIMNEDFVNQRKIENPYAKAEPEKHADVYIQNYHHSFFAVDNGTVFMFNKFLSWNGEAMKKVKFGSDITTKTMTSPELVECGWFIALGLDDFENYFTEIFKNPEILPSQEEMNKMSNTNWTNRFESH